MTQPSPLFASSRPFTNLLTQRLPYMESSASEDEKILRDREQLEQLIQRRDAVALELERIQRGIKRLEERIERKSAMPERSNQSRRQAIHVPTVASGASEATAVGNDSGTCACHCKLYFATHGLIVSRVRSDPSESRTITITGPASPSWAPPQPTLARSQSQAHSRPQRQGSEFFSPFERMNIQYLIRFYHQRPPCLF